MENTEYILLGLITMGAVYYLYHSLFKKKGCNCGRDSCSTVKDKKI